ncbi:MAG: ABC transporter permease [Anaerolineae bacterium]|nr:ABC transporter permease [Anaerolineae bacterium]
MRGSTHASGMGRDAMLTPPIHPRSAPAWKRFWQHPTGRLGAVLLLAVVLLTFGGALFVSENYANTVQIQQRFQAPSAAHPFGTDNVGRDLLARCIYGGQISLLIGLFSALISVLVGTLVGLVSGYFGGALDFVLMRLTEALLAIPALVLLLLFARALAGNPAVIQVPGREPLSASVLILIGLIGLLGWMRLARLVRAQVLALKAEGFVEAARAAGAGNWRILLTHILPNCAAPIIVTATLGVGAAIVTEAYLSFLGFGVLPPTATWGNILTRVQDQLDEYPWMWLAPGMLMIVTVLAINFIGDGLRDVLDPRER